MSIRIGGSIGPLSASARVVPTDREARAGGQIIVGLVLFCAFVVVVLPPLAFAWSIWTLASARRFSHTRLGLAGVVFVASGLVMAVQGPAIYNWAVHGQTVPNVTRGLTAEDAKRELAAAGFGHVIVEDRDGHAVRESAGCRVVASEPRGHARAATTGVLTLVVQC